MVGLRDAWLDNMQWALRIKKLLLLEPEGKSCVAFAPQSVAYLSSTAFLGGRRCRRVQQSSQLARRVVALSGLATDPAA